MKKTAFLSFIVALGFAGSVFAASGSDSQRGKFSGEVIEAATGKPIAGAYVGVGDFGDSGGSNYSRHRQQGLHAKTKTDEQGHFILEGLAYRDHPLVVTHPEFVRHDQIVTLAAGAPEPDVKIALKPAAKINVTVVDSADWAVDDIWHIRLEALDGHRFIPPGEDPHLSTFASSVWVDRPRRRLTSTGFSFTGLSAGQYAVEVMKYAKIDNATAPEGMVRIPLDTANLAYYGGVSKIEVEPGQAKDLRIKPTDYGTSVKIKVPQVPEKYKKMRMFPFIVISRNVGLLLWDDGKVHHPEDHRLGRLQKNALYYNMVLDGDVLTFKNLPPGTYCVFGGPVYFMSAAKVEVLAGREIAVELPSITPTEQARVNLWTFDRKIKLKDKLYSVLQLCELITTRTDSDPSIVCDSSIASERLEIGNKQATIWELVEEVYLAKGWKLTEKGDKQLLLGPVQ